jgi:hypothetical protein
MFRFWSVGEARTGSMKIFEGGKTEEGMMVACRRVQKRLQLCIVLYDWLVGWSEELGPGSPVLWRTQQDMLAKLHKGPLLLLGL